MTYSNRSLEQRMTIAKISLHCILKKENLKNCDDFLNITGTRVALVLSLVKHHKCFHQYLYPQFG